MDVELTEKLMAELSGIFNWALEVGRDYALAKDSTDNIPVSLTLKHKLADKLVYSKLKDKTDQAIKRAKKIRKNQQFDLKRGRKVYELNPYTDADVLVEKLLKL